MPSHVIWLYIGGTSMVAGIIAAEDGHVRGRLSVPTDSQRGAEDGLRRITELIEQSILNSGLSRHVIGGIGMGAAGPVDSITWGGDNRCTVSGWDNMALIRYLTAEFRMAT